MRCRKNQATLTAQEKARFVAALLALKANGTYDQYVVMHVNAMSYAHKGPAFFPWHREMLRRMELDLQSVDADVTLPYWDWTVDNSVTSSIWNDDFMGGNGRPSDGKVMSGPFAFDAGNWPQEDGGPLTRRMAQGLPTLPTPTDLANALATVPYDLAPYNWSGSLAGFRNTTEGWRNGPQLHNRVHVWVGGSMNPMTSPNDPVFFLHHCFIDKCWADWQALHPGEPAFLPTNGAAAGQNLNDSMEPWASLGIVVTPASVVDHHALGYAYDTESVCQPTLKFHDDIVVKVIADKGSGLKHIIDSTATLKLSDDRPTLKIHDDAPTLKLVDDGGTLKFSDDGGTVKFVDDGGGTLKFLDDGGTLKALDDVKTPALDIGGEKPITDVVLPGRGEIDPRASGAAGAGGGAPFILVTPHHTMAWAKTFPGALEKAIAQLDLQLASFEGVVAELEKRNATSDASTEEKTQLELHSRELETIREEREALSRYLRE